MRNFKYLQLLSLVSIVSVYSQNLPNAAQLVLDRTFHGWQLRPNHVPNPCDMPKRLAPSFPTLIPCKLNSDSVTDFAVALTVGKDSAQTEYFVALVSRDDSYDLFILASASAYRGLGQRKMHVIQAGDTISYFGFSDQKQLLLIAKVADASHNFMLLSTDAIEIYPDCESTWKVVESSAYVFVHNKFLNFGTAD